MAALTIHHTHGRSKKSFQTLCFNCHMVLHSPKAAGFTYEDHLSMERDKKIFLKSRADEWEEMALAYYKEKSFRGVARKFNVSHITVRNAVKYFVRGRMKVVREAVNLQA